MTTGAALLDCVEHTPGGPVTGAVIWLHGLGASGNDFSPLVPHLQLPTVRFVFPHAPESAVTINAGYVMPSWYDIRSLDHEHPDREDPAGVQRSAEAVRALIAREVERGVPEHRIVLAGFSQGAAMALYTGARHPRRLAGWIALSGYLVLERALDVELTEAARGTPVFVGHGTRDEVVPIAGGREAHRRLAAAGVAAEWHDWPIGHEVSGEEVRAVARFLHHVLP
ncbi:MAG: alpha/beta fold hydrolase [Myxococcota bacterium]